MTSTDQLFHSVAGSLLEVLQRRQKFRRRLTDLELAVKLAYLVQTFTTKEQAGTLTDTDRVKWEELQELLRCNFSKQTPAADPDIPEYLT